MTDTMERVVTEAMEHWVDHVTQGDGLGWPSTSICGRLLQARGGDYDAGVLAVEMIDYRVARIVDGALKSLAQQDEQAASAIIAWHLLKTPGESLSECLAKCAETLSVGESTFRSLLKVARVWVYAKLEK